VNSLRFPSFCNATNLAVSRSGNHRSGQKLSRLNRSEFLGLIDFAVVGGAGEFGDEGGEEVRFQIFELSQLSLFDGHLAVHEHWEEPVAELGEFLVFLFEILLLGGHSTTLSL